MIPDIAVVGDFNFDKIPNGLMAKATKSTVPGAKVSILQPAPVLSGKSATISLPSNQTWYKFGMEGGALLVGLSLKDIDYDVAYKMGHLIFHVDFAFYKNGLLTAYNTLGFSENVTYEFLEEAGIPFGPKGATGLPEVVLESFDLETNGTATLGWYAPAFKTGALTEVKIETEKVFGFTPAEAYIWSKGLGALWFNPHGAAHHEVGEVVVFRAQKKGIPALRMKVIGKRTEGGWWLAPMKHGEVHKWTAPKNYFPDQYQGPGVKQALEEKVSKMAMGFKIKNDDGELLFQADSFEIKSDAVPQGLQVDPKVMEDFMKASTLFSGGVVSAPTPAEEPPTHTRIDPSDPYARFLS